MAATILTQERELADQVAAISRAHGWWDPATEDKWYEMAADMDLAELKRWLALARYAAKEEGGK